MPSALSFAQPLYHMQYLNKKYLPNSRTFTGMDYLGLWPTKDVSLLHGVLRLLATRLEVESIENHFGASTTPI
jgi:hypothetical protein